MSWVRISKTSNNSSNNSNNVNNSTVSSPSTTSSTPISPRGEDKSLQGKTPPRDKNSAGTNLMDKFSLKKKRNTMQYFSNLNLPKKKTKKEAPTPSISKPTLLPSIPSSQSSSMENLIKSEMKEQHFDIKEKDFLRHSSPHIPPESGTEGLNTLDSVTNHVSYFTFIFLFFYILTSERTAILYLFTYDK